MMATQTNHKNMFELPVDGRDLVTFQAMKMFFSNKVKAPKLLMEKVQAIDKEKRLFFETIDPTLLDKCLLEVDGERLSLKEEIAKEYKRYKKMIKYVSDEYEPIEPLVMSFNSRGEVEQPDCSLATFKKCLLEKCGAPCISWIQHINQFAWIDKGDAINQQFKMYRKAIKEGKAKVLEGNNTTQLLDKKEWHSLVITPTSGGDICAGSFSVFKYMVSGYVYWFTNKENRDAMYQYLIKV